jgi:hypothetical protein
MVELYWITRLGPITTCLDVITALFIAIAIVGIPACFLARLDMYSEQRKEFDATAIKNVKKFMPIVILIVLLRLFIPTTKEALIIYGIGNTIEYIQSNDKAKELPDKVIDALTKYVDSIEKEE